ncbi:hypothetical protein [Kiloniella antarctica]|uniref:Uncharacterized protein n=1 Tax=Kiloniella antarctica TaxID=1550907 RepID=A0ABW5BFY7_9PROT
MIFGFFGRKKEIHMIDDGLRDSGAYSSSISDAVKLALYGLAKDRGLLQNNAEQVLHDLACFLTYCFLGTEDFEDANGADLSKDMLRRLEMTKVFDESVDADIVLLALHSGIAHETTAGRFSVEEDNVDESDDASHANKRK